MLLCCVFAAKAQGINLSKIRREALEFLEGKDADKEFPEITFKINGETV